MPDREFILRQLRTLRDTLYVTGRKPLADEADLLLTTILDMGWSYTDLEPDIRDFTSRVRLSVSGRNSLGRPSQFKDT